MAVCECCHQPVPDKCPLCREGPVEYNAWFRVTDRFTGKPTGVNQRWDCCAECAKKSIACEGGKKLSEAITGEEW